MSAPTQATDVVTKLTDAAIRNELNKLARMIAHRQVDVAELTDEIAGYAARRDELLRVQIERLQAQLSKEAANG